MKKASSAGILVLDGDSRACLAVTRSLGRAGYRVSVGERSKRALACYSKYCSERVVYPSPKKEREQFVWWIIERMEEGNYRWIMPVSDLTLLPLMEAQGAYLDESPKSRDNPRKWGQESARSRTDSLRAIQSPFLPSLFFGASSRCAQSHERLPNRERLLTPSPSSFEATFDKTRTLELAKELEIPTPSYRETSSPDEAAAFAEAHGYPVVVKPPRSRFWSGGEMVHGFRAFAHDEKRLRDEVGKLAGIGVKPLIQEFVRGRGVGIDLVAASGEIIGAVRHRRLREDPPSGGASTLRVSEPISERLLDYAQRFVAKLNWTGPMMVEFKEDPESGGVSLMEVNGRFWGSLQLAVDSGMDLPALLMERIDGSCGVRPPEYRPGTRTRWTVGELRYLAGVWSNVDDAARSKNFATEALRVFGGMCNPFIRDDTFKWNDPLPGLYETAHFLGRAVRRGRIL